MANLLDDPYFHALAETVDQLMSSQGSGCASSKTASYVAQPNPSERWSNGASSVLTAMVPLSPLDAMPPGAQLGAPTPSFLSDGAAPGGFFPPVTTSPQGYSTEVGAKWAGLGASLDRPPSSTFSGANLAALAASLPAGPEFASSCMGSSPHCKPPGPSALRLDLSSSAAMPAFLPSAPHGGLTRSSWSLPQCRSANFALLGGYGGGGWHAQLGPGAALGGANEVAAPMLAEAHFASVRAIIQARAASQDARLPLPSMSALRPGALSSSCWDPPSAAASSETDAGVGAPSTLSQERRAVDSFWATHSAAIAIDAAARIKRVPSAKLPKTNARKRVCTACGRAKNVHSILGKRGKCLELTCACGLLIKLHARLLPAGVNCTGECLRVLNSLSAKQFGERPFGCRP